MRNRLRRQVRRCKMVGVASFAGMRPENKRVEPARTSPEIKTRQVGKHVVHPGQQLRTSMSMAG